jgi:beta-lactamase regulating signal transducer with metallopeptidase domain
METLLDWSSLPGFDSPFTHFAALASSHLFSAAWEGMVLAGCVFVCLRMFPGLSAAARSAVWLNVFLLLVLLNALPSSNGHILAGSVGRRASLQLAPVWSLVIAGVWVMLSCFRGLQLLVSAVRLHRLASRATAISPLPPLRGLLEIRNRRGEVIRAAELSTSSEVQRPSVIGFLRPRILVPPALLERLSAVELEQVVVHEMEHLRRGDDWTNLLQKVALVLFPLNPALLWVERRLCAERELACDDSVLRSHRGRKSYAVCLTRLAEFSMLERSVSLVLGAWERQSELVRRVHRILGQPGKSMGRKQTLLLTGSLMAGVVACAAGLSRTPQLVGFAEPDTAIAQAEPLPVSDFRQTAGSHFGASAQLMKAVMPPTRGSSSFKNSVTPKPASAPRLIQKNVLVKNGKLSRMPSQQAWVLMTTWTETEVAPHMVLTVEHRVRRLVQDHAAMAELEQTTEQPEQSQYGDQTETLSSPAERSTPARQVEQAMPRYAAVPFANGWLIFQI